MTCHVYLCTSHTFFSQRVFCEQGSSGSATLSGRNSLLSSLDSLLAARQASAPVGGARQQPATGAERMLAGLLGALRHQQRTAEEGPGSPAAAAAAAPAQPALAAALGAVAQQVSDANTIQVRNLNMQICVMFGGRLTCS